MSMLHQKHELIPAAPAKERRRRPRLHSATEGWILPEAKTDGAPGFCADGEPWEVRVRDISRNGVGFESTQRIEPGAMLRIRIGRGPMRLARRIRVVNCRAGSNGHYLIGAELLASPRSN